MQRFDLNLIFWTNLMPTVVPFPERPQIERRFEKRRPTIERCTIIFGAQKESAFSGILLNKSSQGVMVGGDNLYITPEYVWIEFPDGSQRYAQRIWAKFDKAGYRFYSD